MNVLNFICVHSQTLTQKEFADTMHPKHVALNQEDDETVKASKIAKEAVNWDIVDILHWQREIFKVNAMNKRAQLAMDKLRMLLSLPLWIQSLEEGNLQQWLCSNDQSQ